MKGNIPAYPAYAIRIDAKHSASQGYRAILSDGTIRIAEVTRATWRSRERVTELARQLAMSPAYEAVLTAIANGTLPADQAPAAAQNLLAFKESLPCSEL